MGNKTLTGAKKAKNDEFYTQYADIEKEVLAYFSYNADVFRGKIVYCNCDDPYESHFFGFFAQNFQRLGLKRLMATSYKPSPIANTLLPLFGDDATLPPAKDRPKITANRFIIDDTSDLDGDGGISLYDIAAQLRANKNNEWAPLEGNGDFLSEECIALLKQADIVVTNPPFSLFRKYVAQLMEYDKKFLIIGNMNAVTYKEIFPLIKENMVWLGATGYGKDMVFAVPNGAEIAESDRQKAARLGYVGDYTRLGNSCWFSRLDHGRRHEPLLLQSMAKNKKYNQKIRESDVAYQQYDNYEAIEVPYTDGIPSDYDGVMGVPISFLDKYNPDQFEIVGLTSGRDEFECRPIKKYVNPKQHNPNGSVTNGSKANTRATLKLKNTPNSIYYTAENCSDALAIVYARLLIRHRKR